MMKLPHKRLFIPILTMCAMLLLLRYKYTLNSIYANLNVNHQLHSSTNDTKYVLFWTQMFRSKIMYFPTDGFDLFKHCQVKNCYATPDRELLPIDEYHAIIFHIPNQGLPGREELPERRREHQRYIFANLESPLYYHGNHTQYVFDDFFNWTMTYRIDSDIPRRYGYTERKSTNYQLPSKEDVWKKKKSIAWFASNCNSFNGREEIVEELRRYIDVDIYGACGNLTCSKSDECYSMLEETYRFYLSFENAHCDDYVTEKLFRTLRKNVVPIVYGRANYEAVAPPNSYINVEDFQSVKNLVDYLMYLEIDVDSYLEYFQWKKEYIVHIYDDQTVCTLCKKLNDPHEGKKTYANIRQWWWDDSNNWGCTKREELSRI